jgi:hypothetical protein
VVLIYAYCNAHDKRFDVQLGPLDLIFYTVYVGDVHVYVYVCVKRLQESSAIVHVWRIYYYDNSVKYTNIKIMPTPAVQL